MPFGRLGLGFGFTAGGTGGLFNLYMRGYGDSTMKYNWSQYSAAGETAFLAAATDYAGTVTFTDAAESGSYLSQLAAVAGGATVNKAWVNDTGALADANQITTKVVNLSGEVSYATLSLGINDHSFLVGAGVDATEFQAMYEYLATRVNAVKGSKIMLNTLGRDTGGNDAGANIVRRAQLNAISNSALIERGVDTYDLEQTDAKHYTQAGQEKFATRIAARTEFLTRNDRVIKGLGPSATAVLKTDKIEISLTHQNGTDITAPSAGNGGFDAEDDGVQMGSTYLTRVNATTMRLEFPQGKAPVVGSVVELFMPYGCNGTGLNQASPDVARDNSALMLPIQSDIITVTNSDPFQALDNVVIYWDARGSVKTLTSSTELDAIAKIAGSVASVNEVAAGDHATWDTSGMRLNGALKFRAETDMNYSSAFTAGGTHAIMIAMRMPETMAGANSNMLAFANSAGTTDTNARLTFASNNALYWSSNEAAASQQVTPIFTGGEVVYILVQFVDVNTCNVYVDVDGVGGWETPYVTFDPRNTTDYESQTYITIGGRSTAEDATLNLEVGAYAHTTDVITSNERSSLLSYWQERFVAPDGVIWDNALFAWQDLSTETWDDLG